MTAKCSIIRVEKIIEPGGQIFFAVVDEKAVGTVALIPMADNAFELAKMAVVPEFRGRGIGDLLMDACIEFPRETASTVYNSRIEHKASCGNRALQKIWVCRDAARSKFTVRTGEHSHGTCHLNA